MWGTCEEYLSRGEQEKFSEMREDQLTPLPPKHYWYCFPITEGYLENRDL